MQPNISTKSDKDLWDLFRIGNKGAFSLLYKRHIKGLFNFGLKHTSNKVLIKDTLQELFIDYWNKRATISKVENVKVYLIKSFRYKLLRSLAKASKNRTYSFDELFLDFTDTEKIEDQLSEARRNALKKQLLKLPERQREVIYLRYYQNLKNAEIAEVLNMNYQSVSNLLQRALKNLRSSITFFSQKNSFSNFN